MGNSFMYFSEIFLLDLKSICSRLSTYARAEKQENARKIALQQSNVRDANK